MSINQTKEELGFVKLKFDSSNLPKLASHVNKSMSINLRIAKTTTTTAAFPIKHSGIVRSNRRVRYTFGVLCSTLRYFLTVKWCIAKCTCLGNYLVYSKGFKYETIRYWIDMSNIRVAVRVRPLNEK